ncbi:MAG TPA: hypothetical protein VGW10_19040 [Solirubrobacteraceae bacterium]|nr:hypothetical protein [Solirubrobacteraceae bacterium]
MRAPSACPKMTRREALAIGAAAGVTASVGIPPDAIAAAAGGVVGDGAGPDYLRRSTYLDLVGEDFTVGPHALRLTTVEDVLGAAVDRALKGHEHAFALAFEGPADVLAGEIHELSHPLIGPFPLFISAVGAVRGLAQTYGVTVDRSVRVRLASAPSPGGGIAPPATTGRAAEGKGDTPEQEPSVRDLAVLQERLVAAAAPLAERRRRTRRAGRKVRRTLDNRIRFKRKQHARVRRVRTGWLKRHNR